jgi:abelson tyrosine-protein kinase 1
MPQPVLFTPSINNASSIFETATSESDDDNNLDLLVYEGYDSPPPANERLAELRNERRYRLLLDHEFHRSRESLSYQLFIYFISI